MALSPHRTDHDTGPHLPCGRRVAHLAADLDAGHDPDPHTPACPHCSAALDSLETLLSATQVLRDDPAPAPDGLLERIMDAVRAEGRHRDPLALPSDAGPIDISPHAVAAVLRWAVDGVDGLRAHSCRITPTEHDRPTRPDDSDDLDRPPGRDAETIAVWMSVSLRYRAGDARALLTAARARIQAALGAQIGLHPGPIDLELVDVWTPTADTGPEDSSGDAGAGAGGGR